MKFGILFKKHFKDPEGMMNLMTKFGYNFVLLEEKSPRTVDYVICFGGDGTILRSVPYSVKYNAPVLGINFGKIGFLTDYSIDDLKDILKRIKESDFTLNTKMLIDLKVYRKKKLLFDSFALNDAVLFKTKTEKMLTLKLVANRKFVYETACDGIILSTPTGSTAYSLAAGGPFISPSLSAIITTPICPYNINIRPIIFADTEIIEVHTMPFYPVNLQVDGENVFVLEPEDKLIVKKSKNALKFVELKDKNYFKKVMKTFIE